MSEPLTLDSRWRVAVRLLDIDVPELAVDVGDGYDHAMLFFFSRGSVVGRAVLPLSDGIIPRGLLSDRVEQIMRDRGANTPALAYRATVPLRYQPSVSVVVCTRDRASVLRECLQSLVSVDWEAPEIVVVDNSSDPVQTERLLKEFPSIRYIRCPKPGLDRSRNVGIRATSGEIIAFTDDDAQVHRSWLKGLVGNFRDPMVAAATGITLPADLDSRPQLEFEMTSTFGKGFVRKEFTLTNTSIMNVAQIGAGVNMAVRRAAFEDVGLFDESLDGGTPTMSGGDHELFYRAITRGYRIAYDPSAIVWHRHRATTETATRAVFGYGVGVLAWWTRSLVREREYSVILRAPLCILQYHARRFLGSLLNRPGSPPLRYSAAELAGALYGPFAYWKSVMANTD